MSSKRLAVPDECATSPIKKGHFELWGIGPVCTQKEMDFKLLKFQNKKLCERLNRCRKQEAEFQQRIEQLEKRHASDAAILCVVNRHWNQLNKDLSILLQTFGPKTEENEKEEAKATSFLELLQWDKEELGERLSQRVKISTMIFAKVLQMFDHIVQKNREIILVLKGKMGRNGLVSEMVDSVQQDEKNVYALVASLHKRHHQMSLKLSDVEDKLTATESLNKEFEIKVRDLEYNLNKAKSEREESALSTSVVESLQNWIIDEGMHPTRAVLVSQLDAMQKELEEQKTLASSRIAELEALNKQHKDAVKLIESLKINCIPESVVETKEYKHLQSQFCMLVNDRLNLKTMLEKTRKKMDVRESEHQALLEEVQGKALGIRKSLQDKIIKLESSLAQLRIEHSILKSEFEQNVAANERSKLADEEMRLFIHSLQNYNYQLKSSMQRYKRKLEEVSTKNLRIFSVDTKQVLNGSFANLPSNATEVITGKNEISHDEGSLVFNRKDKEFDREGKVSKQLLKEPQNMETKFLLSVMYEENCKLQRDEEDALLNELEVTGQAFENMQEQNLRLIQQIREKDDINLRTVSEKLQLRHINKTLVEEKEVLNKQIIALENEITKQNKVIRTLEEKSELLQSEVDNIKKELVLSQQTTEIEKRKATKSAELAADLKVRLEECSSELEKARSAVTESMQPIQPQASENPEKNLLKETEHRVTNQSSSDMVGEDLKLEFMEFKELVICPSCKIKRKDAVLTKCFHVFCFDCLKIRYESRQRRCPECNCSFGAKDFHRLYLM